MAWKQSARKEIAVNTWGVEPSQLRVKNSTILATRVIIVNTCGGRIHSLLMALLSATRSMHCVVNWSDSASS